MKIPWSEQEKWFRIHADDFGGEGSAMYELCRTRFQYGFKTFKDEIFFMSKRMLEQMMLEEEADRRIYNCVYCHGHELTDSLALKEESIT